MITHVLEITHNKIIPIPGKNEDRGRLDISNATPTHSVARVTEATNANNGGSLQAVRLNR
jgi:hypothetical protein